VGVLNVARPEIVELLIDRLAQHYDSDSLEWWHVVQLPRIVAELCNANVLSIEQLDTFFMESVQYADGSACGELVAMALLLALPWIKASLVPKLTSLESTLNSIGALAEQPNRSSRQASAFSAKLPAEFCPFNDALASCYLAIRTLSAFPPRIEPYNAFESTFAEAKGNSEWSLRFSKESLRGVSVAPFNSLVLFPQEETFAGLANAGDATIIYFRFQLHMLTEAYELNHRRGAEVLFTSLPEVLEHRERVICEVLLGKLLSCDLSSDSRRSYYEVLLIDCCRLSRGFPPTMARSLLKLVSSMSVASWFAHHLSHYDFKWNWTEWRGDATNTETPTVKRIFLRFLIFKLLSLSYHEKMQAVLPEYMLGMLPYPVGEETLATGPMPSELVHGELVARMKQRLPIEELKAFVESAKISRASVLETVLHVGSKTFSHLLNALERYRGLLSETLQASVAMPVIRSFWTNNIQNQHIVIEKLVHYGVIEHHDVTEYILDELCSVLEASPMDLQAFERAVLLVDPWLLLNGLVTKADEPAQMAIGIISRLSNMACSDAMAQWFSTGLTKIIVNSYLVSSAVAKDDSLSILESLVAASESSPAAIKDILVAAQVSVALGAHN
jgi:hypothetical protein